MTFAGHESGTEDSDAVPKEIETLVVVDKKARRWVPLSDYLHSENLNPKESRVEIMGGEHQMLQVISSHSSARPKVTWFLPDEWRRADSST